MLKQFIKFLTPTTLLLLTIATLLPLSVFATPAVLGDYNGDRLTDLAITRGSGLYKFWYLRYSNNSLADPILFGLKDDLESSADYDGDGDVEPGVTRSSTSGFVLWYYLTNTNLTESISWGLKSDTLRTGYFDSDDKADLIAIRKETNNFLTWYIRRSSDGNASVFNWGISGDTPYIANLDADRINDAVIVRKNNGFLHWYVRSSGNGSADSIVFGLQDDKLMQPADLDGNGVDDFIVYRKIGIYLQFYIRFNNSNGTSSGVSTYSFGLEDDIMNVGTYLSTSVSNLSAFRAKQGLLASNLFRVSDGSFMRVDFGLGGDTIVNSRGNGLSTQITSTAKAPEELPAAVITDGISTVCASTRSPSKGFLWKPASDDSGGTRQGRPMVAWKSSPPTSKACLKVYASNGKQVSQFGRYTTGGSNGARYYSGWTCGDKKSAGQISQAANSASGSVRVYIEGPGNSCIGPITPTSRNGSL